MLTVTLGDRTDTLADLLARRLSEIPPDPFAPEWVVVGSIGMRRWLSQYLSARLGSSPGRSDGVTANVSFPFPSELRRAVTRPTGGDAVDPWHVDSLQFLVLAELGALGVEPGLVRARRIAGLLDRYHHRRHEMISAWAEGRALDGGGGPLPDRYRWQYDLWHRVRLRIERNCDDPALVAHPVARLTRAVDALRDGSPDQWPGGLPHRLFVAGLNHATPDLLDIISALAVGRPVEVLWLASSTRVTRAGIELGRRDGIRPPAEMAEPLSMLAHHPLAVSWGAAAREGAVLLGARTSATAREGAGSGVPHDAGGSTLRILHADIEADSGPTPAHASGVAQRISLHACAGASRQAEVACDEILHLLADDHTLTERDIAVICPDVDRFAAPVRAAFGPPGDILDYRIVSRAAPLANGRIDALLGALDLVGGRVTAGDVTSLLAAGAVRTRFGLDHDDLSTVGRWVDALAIRWGLDGPRREHFGMPASFTHNTWLRAVRSLLLGIALDPEDDVDPTPFAVDGSDVVLAGRLAEFVELLSRIDIEFSEPVPWRVWADRLRRLDAALSESDAGREWERERLHARLSLLERAEAPANDDTAVDVADVRQWLRDELGGGSAAARVGDGSIVVCSPSVVRSVPFRAVVLMGLDQTSAGVQSSDDLVAAAPRLGDPDHRVELRQQLLDAVMAASDHLVVTYDAVDPAGAQEVPPSALLDELTECLASMGLVTGRPDDCVVHHTRLAVAEENFRPDAAGRVRSFDTVSLSGAIAARRGDAADPLQRARRTRVDPDGTPHVGVAELVVAVTNAPQAFAQQTLGVGRGPDESGGHDDLIVSLAGLDRWALGQEVLAHRLSGSTRSDPVSLWSRRGLLPVGSAGDSAVEEITDVVDALIAAAWFDGRPSSASTTVAVDVGLESGRRLAGSVGDVHTDGVLRHVAFSTASAKHLLSAWVRLLVLTAAGAACDSAVVVGRHSSASGSRNSTRISTCHLSVRGDSPDERRDLALDRLATLDTMHRRATSAALPSVAATSFAMGRALKASGDDERAAAKKAARAAWSGFSGHGDATDPWVRLFFDGLGFDDLYRDEEARRLAIELVDVVDGSVTLSGDHEFGGAM